MERVGLARRLYDNYPSQLSGGQRQRVAIARALINRPRIVICDEPTSALDVSVQSQILNLLQDLRRDMGLTYLLISHNLAVVEHMATRVAVMYLGRIVEEADTDELFRAPKHPYTQALLASVLTPEPGLGVPDTQLGAAYPNPLDVPPGCRFHPRCARVMEVAERLRQRRSLTGARLRRMPSLRCRHEEREGCVAMPNSKASRTRAGAVARARAYVESGAFETELARASPSGRKARNCRPACRELRRYLDERNDAGVRPSGLHDARLRQSASRPGPGAAGDLHRGAALPTVLGYGHGDVIRGLEDQWTKGKGPWITARDGDRLYGRGTADNKGQHTLNMAALDAVRAERGGRLGFNAKFIIEMGEEAGSKGLAELVRRQQGGVRGRRAHRLRRPAREARTPDHDARLPRRHQLRSRRATCARAGITPATGAA